MRRTFSSTGILPSVSTMDGPYSFRAGALFPAVWPLTLFSMSLALALCYVYDPLRRAAKRGETNFFYFLFDDAQKFLAIVTTFVTFILGFFNATVFSRWWKLRELCGTVNGRTVDTSCMVSAYLVKNNSGNCLRQRRLLIRYLSLGHALHVMSIKYGKVDLEELVKNKLLEANGPEFQALSLANKPDFNIVYAWFLQSFSQCIEDGYISSKVSNAAMQRFVYYTGNMSPL